MPPPSDVRLDPQQSSRAYRISPGILADGYIRRVVHPNDCLPRVVDVREVLCRRLRLV